MMQWIQYAYDTITNCWVFKMLISVISGILIYLFEMKHVQILFIFTCLVVLDLFTKWSALAYKMLTKDGVEGSKLSVLDKYWAIPLAFERGIISSEYMRKGFTKKVLTYVAATVAAFLFDQMAGGVTGKSNFAVNLVWLYLGSAEFLSVLENLRDGGNMTIGRFLELAKNKIEAKVKL